MRDFIYLIAIVGWLIGIVLSTGKMVIVACLFAPYSWYLVIEHAMKLAGFI